MNSDRETEGLEPQILAKRIQNYHLSLSASDVAVSVARGAK